MGWQVIKRCFAKRFIVRSFCSTRITHVDILTDTLHHRLACGELPRTTVKSVQNDLKISRREAQIIYDTSEVMLMRNVASLTYTEGDYIYLPCGAIVEVSLMHWLGGLFDGDGCVKTEKTSTALQMRQQSHFVGLFPMVFGGNVGHYGRTVQWQICGCRTYFISKALHPFTRKKQEELNAIVDFYEKKLSHAECDDILRNLKDSYPTQVFDVSDWHLAYLAGWIDSDGSISIDDAGGKCKPFARVVLKQKNYSICKSLAARFGGSAWASRNGQCQWKVERSKAYDFTKRIEPYLRHKHKQAQVILEKHGNFSPDDHKLVFAYNTQNNQAAYNKFLERFGQKPEEYVA